MSYISPSKINTFFECPYKYYLSYVENLKPLYKPQYVFGSKVHEVIKKYYELIPDSITASEVPMYVSVAWKEVFGDVTESAYRYMDGFVKFESHRLLWNINPKPLAIEKEFARGRLKGVVDALFRRGNEYVVVDWKTGMVRNPYEHQYLLVQGNIYMYLTSASICYFVFVGYGDWREVKYDKTFLDNIVEKFVSSVDRGLFNRNKGEWCRLCEFNVHCYLKEYSINWWEL